jgi:hypothetical protein
LRGRGASRWQESRSTAAAIAAALLGIGFAFKSLARVRSIENA